MSNGLLDLLHPLRFGYDAKWSMAYSALKVGPYITSILATLAGSPLPHAIIPRFLLLRAGGGPGGGSGGAAAHHINLLLSSMCLSGILA
jgi:hypothetical protein